MLSLETFESQISAVMQTLVEVVVAELQRLMNEWRANAVAAQRRSAAAAVTADITPSEEEQQFFKDVTRQFASLMETCTKNVVEKISMLLKMSISEAEQRTGLNEEIKETSTSPKVTQIPEPSKESAARMSQRGRRKRIKTNDHIYCRVEQQGEDPTAGAAASEPEPEPEPDAACGEESSCGPEPARRSATPEPAFPEPDVSEGAAASKVKKKKTSAGSLKCPSCDKSFTRRCLMQRHYLVHSKPHGCSACGKRFAALRGLTAHFRKHSGEKLYKCSDCGTEFAYKSTYHRHLLNHSGERPPNSLAPPKQSYTCTLCEGHYAGKAAFERHRCCALKKTFVCSVCPETFDCRQSLAEHESLHAGDRGFICEMCGDAFLSSSSLATHRVTHTQGAACCDVLGLGCSDMSVLRVHLSKHTGEKLFACDVCGKGCSHQSALKHHMLTHTGERPYVCEVCGKRCGHPSALQNHMRVHTGRKPGQKAVCGVCGKTMSSHAKLKLHTRIHTGEKPHACEQCGKTFNNPSNLRTHAMAHSGRKLYGCVVCGKRFAQSSSLKLHRRLHAGEAGFHCRVCGKVFMHGSGLRKHQQDHPLEEGGGKRTEAATGQS